MAIVGAFDSAGTLVTHAELNGRSVITNGFQMLKYNPVTGSIIPAVLRPFRGAYTLAAGPAGVLIGDYQYQIVPYNENEDEEGPVMADYEEFAAANTQVVVGRAGLRRDSPEITHWRIYRTIAGGVYPVMGLVATVPWATVNYNDNTADGDIDVANQGINQFIWWPTPKAFLWTHISRMFGIGDIPYDRGTIQVTNGSAIIVPNVGAVFGFWCEGKEIHIEGDGRAYTVDEYDPATGSITVTEDYGGANDNNASYRMCGDPDTALFTEPGFENQWPPINNFPVMKKEGDKPTGGMGVPGGCVVTKSRKTYLWSFDNFPHIPYGRADIISDQHGGISHNTMRMVNDVPTWVSKISLVQFSRSGIKPISRKVNDWVRDNLDLNSDGTQQICFAVTDTEKEQYIVFIKSNSDLIGCSKAIVWHYAENKFTTWEFDTEFTCGSVVKTETGDDEIHIGCVNGFVWKLGFGDADGPPINSTVSGTVDSYIFAGSPQLCIIVDEDAQYPTSGLGLAGVPIYVHTGTGAGQKTTIVENTGTTLTVECLGVDLDETSEYYIGRIEARYKTGWLDFGTIDRIKDFKYFNLVYEKEEDSTLRIIFYKEFDEVPEDLREQVERMGITDTGETSGSIDLTQVARQRMPVGGIKAHHIAVELYDGKPNNPFTVFDVSFDYRYGDN